LALPVAGLRMTLGRVDEFSSDDVFGIPCGIGHDS
jgi:hypothetical protein